MFTVFYLQRSVLLPVLPNRISLRTLIQFIPFSMLVSYGALVLHLVVSAVEVPEQRLFNFSTT